MNTAWVCQSAIIDGQYYEIQGLNIWDYEWTNTQELVSVKDPIYGQTHVMAIYQIITATQTITFAAGEFSNLVWGIYTQV
ncbi:hypothetical protein ABDD95_02805 [Mucilaginibacter sp. PAMB04274]|uniref:hypothetical protein n=1 Tax=Mucilaginibacter sp. PAMB04274 TaxID=3138568 RepID=UPI0031F68592